MTAPSGGVGRYEVKPPQPAQLTVNLPGPAAAAVARVLDETGDTAGAMFAKALGLYMLALDAKKRGAPFIDWRRAST